MSRMHQVLILDGNQRSALAAVRSLGKKGIPVLVGDESEVTLAGKSKYCSGSFAYPSPNHFPHEFIESIVQQVQWRGISVLLPMTEVTTALILKSIHKFQDIAIPFTSFDQFDSVNDKMKLMVMARDLKVAVPETHFIRDLEEIRKLPAGMKFPVVLKPHRSRIWCENRCIEASVRYANSFRELQAVVAREHFFSHHPFMVQEMIRGRGHGVFALYKNGIPVAFFAHRRLRENPPSGGVSVLSESAEMNPKAFTSAKKILDHVQWHGVAMVEFKIAADGIPYLMEINPRFWGSLQLAIDAGVDFPWLTYQMAIGETFSVNLGYKVGIRNRWLVGDAAHLYKMFAGNGKGLQLPWSQKWRSLLGFLDFFDRKTLFEINRWEDLRPFLYELRHRLAK